MVKVLSISFALMELRLDLPNACGSYFFLFAAVGVAAIGQHWCVTPTTSNFFIESGQRLVSSTSVFVFLGLKVPCPVSRYIGIEPREQRTSREQQL